MLQDALHFILLGKIEGILLEFELDSCATVEVRGRFNHIAIHSATGPLTAFSIREPGASEHGHFVGSHEGRVEADTKLANQRGSIFGILFFGSLFFLDGLQESFRPRVGNGTQVFDQFIMGHSAARIGDGNPFFFFVKLN